MTGKRRIELFGVIAMLVASASAQQVYYVNAGSGNDAWDGLCQEWDGGTCGPKATIQAGIDAAVDGDDVVVADGTYTGDGNRDLDFMGKAIAVRSASGDPAACIIDCEGTLEDPHRGFYFHSGETEASVVQGLTITNGYVYDTSPGDANGGGVYCWGSSPTVTNCTICGNSASDLAGGVYCAYSSPTITTCTIRDNSAYASGGVFCYEGNLRIASCRISGNSAEYEGGGGVFCANSNPAITDCTIWGNSANRNGGGVHCWYSSPTITNCTICDNSADRNGAGVYCYSGSPTITDCTISGNSADQGGGAYGVWSSSPTIANCTITGNAARYGGGVQFRESSNPTITNCTISENTASGTYVVYGGGVYCDGDSDPIVTNCTIRRNSASGIYVYGGGVFCDGSSPTVVNSAISENTVSGDSSCGGGVYCCGGNPTVTSSMIYGNSAINGDGGGVYCDSLNNPTITNCTIYGNSADNSGGGVMCYGGSLTLANCILWSDSPSEICDSSAGVTATYCDIQGGWEGEGNIDADPLFVDPDGPDDDPATWEDNDYHLAAGSPCVDAGDPEFVPPPGETDMDGEARVWDGDGDGVAVVDMGADEANSFVFGDLDCDGATGAFDIDAFVKALTGINETPPFASYMAAYPDCDPWLADCNGDGNLDAFDIDPFIVLLTGG